MRSKELPNMYCNPLLQRIWLFTGSLPLHTQGQNTAIWLFQSRALH